MPGKNATLVLKLHKCHIFEKAPSSISESPRKRFMRRSLPREQRETKNSS